MSPFVMIALDHPYRLDAHQVRYTFIGWTEVDDLDAPDVELSINGRPVPITLPHRPDVEAAFPDLKAMGIRGTVDFRSLLTGADPQQDQGGFVLEATVRSDQRMRTFQYAVSDAWMAAVFGPHQRARPAPPDHLQNRVAGATGEYLKTGLEVAERIDALASRGGFAWPDGARVLDFGCGPGRVITALQPRHPNAVFHGSDIDPEAIAWDQANLAHAAAFAVNGHAPPLPYSDAEFDFIYSISIFTHLPEDHQFAWLADLRRVLKPGGLLLTTTMNPYSPYLPQDIHRSADATGFAYWGDAGATEGLPDFYRLAYHSHDYLRREWGRDFDLLEIGDHDINGLQDSVLLRHR